MPKEDWQDILDATRVKLESTELLRSGEVGDAIRSIITGTMPSGDPITSEAEFLEMDTNGDYYLANDITLSRSYGTFRGRLYGNNATVTTSVPLFEELEGASIYELTIKGTVNLPSRTDVGALTCTATTASVYRVVNEADVTASSCAGGLIGFASDTCVFWGCFNAGKVFSEEKAAGILAYGGTDATFTHCGNAGEITVSSKTSTDDGASFAAGIVSWVGGTGIIYYCVNLGEISGNRPVAGIGGRFGETDNVNGHIVFGCVNIGQIHTSSGNVAGLVKRTYGRSKFNFNIVSGLLKTDDGVVSGIIDYNTSSDTDYSNNVIMLDQDSVAGTSTYVVCANTGSSLSVGDSNFRNIYIFNDGAFRYFFKRKSGSSYSIPSSYSYYFTGDELVDESLIERLGGDFVIENKIPMHRGVVGTYRLAREISAQTSPSATFAVNFLSSAFSGVEEQLDPDNSCGYYTIDGGKEVYFDYCFSITISEGLCVSSKVRIYADWEDTDCLYTKDNIGCTEDEIGGAGLQFDAPGYVEFTIVAENASATICDTYC